MVARKAKIIAHATMVTQIRGITIFAAKWKPASTFWSGNMLAEYDTAKATNNIVIMVVLVILCKEEKKLMMRNKKTVLLYVYDLT